MKGTIFDIQRFCVHDGPGIRTTVFLKGCPLRCVWCHNPESQRGTAEVAYYADRCACCGACSEMCPQNCHVLDGEAHRFDREACIACGQCATSCSFGALELIGRRESSETVLSEILRDKNFYKHSGGGVTFSGGEPLMQSDFLIELLKGAKAEGIHTCVETCGYASAETLKKVARETDLFLFDIKETNDERHKALTGVSFAPIRENLMLLDEMGANLVLRCPLVYGVNTSEEHLEGIARLASSLDKLHEVDVMAYHRLGNRKYEALAMENKMPEQDAMTIEQKEECIRRIAESIQKHCKKSIKVC